MDYGLTQFNLSVLVQLAIAAQQFLQTVDPDLRRERLPYFGKYVVGNRHYTDWIDWAGKNGMTQAAANEYAQGIRNFIFNGTSTKRR